jgi:caffeoyl-CoA O-methyltransferase
MATKTETKWIPTSTDLDWIESESPTLDRVFLAIEEAAGTGQGRIPILHRPSGRVLASLAVGRRRIVEVGTAYGFSTLWMALAQPADGTIVTIDPDRERTERARAWWREAGVADGRISVVNKPALDAFAADDPALRGPFDLAFVDALKEEYERYVDAIVPRLVPGALLVADNVLWSGRVSGERPSSDDDGTKALRSFNRRMLRDRRFVTSILPVGDGLLVAGYRG